MPSMPGMPFMPARMSSMSSFFLGSSLGASSTFGLSGASLFASHMATKSAFSAQPSHLRPRSARKTRSSLTFILEQLTSSSAAAEASSDARRTTDRMVQAVSLRAKSVGRGRPASTSERASALRRGHVVRDTKKREAS
eukprot:922057-Prymnesium_polylepis.1